MSNTDFDGEDPEVPEADAIEQSQVTDGEATQNHLVREHLPSDPEIPEADALEQSVAVGQYEEDYERHDH